MNRLTTEADAQLTRSRGISETATPAAAAADAQGAPAAGGRERATGAGRRCAGQGVDEGMTGSRDPSAAGAATGRLVRDGGACGVGYRVGRGT